MVGNFDFLRKKGFWGGVIFGIILITTIFIFLIGGDIKDFANYMGHRTEYDEGNIKTKELFKNYIVNNNNNLNPFLENSQENQKVLIPIFLNLNLGNDVITKLIEITNRESDKFRIVSLLSNYALVEFENNNFDNHTQRIINDLYKSLELILNNNISDYKIAVELLKKSYKKLEKKDNSIKLEVLRYMTYCYFVINDSENALFWLNTAKKIKNEKDISWNDYLSEYFWVDILDLWVSIKANDLKSADNAFNNLTKNADPEFLRSKFRQHEIRLSNEDKKIWNNYLKKVNGN